MGWGSWCQLLLPHQDLFFHYVFNNFLHTQVEVCVSALLSAGPPSDSNPETSAPNAVVKHVSWGSQAPLKACGWALSQVCPAPGLQPGLLGNFTYQAPGACSWGVSWRNGVTCGVTLAHQVS